MSTSPRPQKRTASTCVTCRHRKVRCDGRRDMCTNCERLGFTCTYDDNVGVESTQSDAHAHAHAHAIAVPRRRVRQACLNCHAKKARCSGSVPQCDRCRLQGLECVYRPGKRSMPLPSSASATSDAVMRDESESGYDQAAFAQGSASPSAAGFDPPEPEEALAMKAFESFFKNVHHIPMFSFLHRASLMERHHAGTLDRSLLLAIIGITALFSDMGPGMDEYGERCIDEAAALCLAELERPSILRLQALVLVVKHRILSKRFSSAFMLHAIASRFATALRLNHENPTLCFLARESRRRLMWSIFMIDSALAGGQADFALWPDAEHQIHIQLPCNERHFDFDLPETTEPLRPPVDLRGMPMPMPDVVGFMALHVRIHWIRTRILQCALKAASTPTLEELATLPARCAGLTAELEAFEARMPLSFRWSESNLRLRTYSPRLGIFLMTHVWWRQCHLDLYRMFLPGLKEALPQSALAQLDPHVVAQYRRSCYEHAKAMADMFAQLATPGNGAPVPGTPIADIDLPGCAYQCVRVLYHGLQTAADEMGFSPDRVRSLATECLRAARQSTAGPACASIQSDIEKLIAEGLQLVPASYVPDLMSTSMDDDGMNVPQRPHASCSQTATSGVDSLAMTMSMVSSASMLTMAPVAASNVSGGTGGSNAFEESLDAFSFGGPDLAGPESWAAFSLSNEWLDMGQLGDGGG